MLSFQIPSKSPLFRENRPRGSKFRLHKVSWAATLSLVPDHFSMDTFCNSSFVRPARTPAIPSRAMPICPAIGLESHCKIWAELKTESFDTEA